MLTLLFIQPALESTHWLTYWNLSHENEPVNEAVVYVWQTSMRREVGASLRYSWTHRWEFPVLCSVSGQCHRFGQRQSEMVCGDRKIKCNSFPVCWEVGPRAKQSDVPSGLAHILQRHRRVGSWKFISMAVAALLINNTSGAVSAGCLCNVRFIFFGASQLNL